MLTPGYTILPWRAIACRRLWNQRGFWDSQRWFMLDRIALGHYFDSSALIVYALKLRILLRWDVIERAPAQELLERTIL